MSHKRRSMFGWIQGLIYRAEKRNEIGKVIPCEGYSGKNALNSRREIENNLDQEIPNEFRFALKRTLEKMGARNETILVPDFEPGYSIIRIRKDGEEGVVVHIEYPLSPEKYQYKVIGLLPENKPLCYSKVDAHELEVVSALIVGRIREYPAPLKPFTHPQEQKALPELLGNY